MQRFYSILFAATLIFIAPSVQATDVHVNKDCDNKLSMREINYCSMERFNQADEEMNNLYKEKIAAIKTSRNKERFRDAQRAWITFRDTVCLYEAGLAEETGSVYPFNKNGCMEFHTRKRIKDLKDYISCETDDCPN